MVVDRLHRAARIVGADEKAALLPLEEGGSVHSFIGGVILNQLGWASALGLRTGIFGKQSDDEPGRVELELQGAVTAIGRREGQVLVEDASVSRAHLEIENYGEGLRWVRDLGSTNGTELNDTPLKERRPLVPGDLIQVGRVVIEIAEGSAPPANLDEVLTKTVLFDQDRATA